jgi:hypothetical protein
MKKYEITYHYTVEGIQYVEANNAEEAREKHYEEDYGDEEEVIKHTIFDIKLAK